MSESIEIFNQRLKDQFGRYLDGRQLWRVIFSDNEFEKRHGTYKDFTSEGFFLREVTEVREVPKYRQWVSPPCYILERLIEIPLGAATDQINNTSYEPVWVFGSANNDPLYPSWNAIKVIIDTVYENSAKALGVKYKDPRAELSDPKIAADVREKHLQEIEADLFGNETQVGDALAHKYGVVVPANYESSNN